MVAIAKYRINIEQDVDVKFSTAITNVQASKESNNGNLYSQVLKQALSFLRLMSGNLLYQTFPCNI